MKRATKRHLIIPAIYLVYVLFIAFARYLEYGWEHPGHLWLIGLGFVGALIIYKTLSLTEKR